MFIPGTTLIKNGSSFQPPRLLRLPRSLKMAHLSTTTLIPGNTSIREGRVLWKFCFSKRTSYDELIWCTNYPNVHIHAFCKRWSFIWRCFFPASVLKLNQCQVRNVLGGTTIFWWNSVLSKLRAEWKEFSHIFFLNTSIIVAEQINKCKCIKQANHYMYHKTLQHASKS